MNCRSNRSEFDERCSGAANPPSSSSEVFSTSLHELRTLIVSHIPFEEARQDKGELVNGAKFFHCSRRCAIPFSEKEFLEGRQLSRSPLLVNQLTNSLGVVGPLSSTVSRENIRLLGESETCGTRSGENCYVAGNVGNAVSYTAPGWNIALSGLSSDLKVQCEAE